MAPINNITGVILAGGASSRFGSNKAMAPWRGKVLVQHVRDTLDSVFTDCLLSTNSPELYGFLNLPVIKDTYENMGPMAGIHAALCHTDTPWIFVLGCDMPAVTPAVIVFLCGFAGEDDEAVIPWLETGAEPLCGLYHKTALAQIELQLQNDRPRLKELLEKLSVRKVRETELQKVHNGLQVFANINRKQDLDRLS